MDLSAIKRMKVSLFVTCLVDQIFPEVGLSTVRILRKLGVEVDFDVRQTCCGQPAFNTGFVEEAQSVARHFISVFKDSEKIVVPSGSCCTMIKVFLPELFPKKSKERSLAKSIAERTYELSYFLVSILGVENIGARFSQSVTYHDSCHLLRELKVCDQPRQLIRNIRDIDFREMKDSDRCCGFGGTFSVKFPEVSTAIGSDKLQSIKDTGANYVIANDVSCLMHLDGLLRRQNIPIKTMHIAELLAKFK